jgi:hypothetical protein
VGRLPVTTTAAGTWGNAQGSAVGQYGIVTRPPESGVTTALASTRFTWSGAAWAPLGAANPTRNITRAVANPTPQTRAGGLFHHFHHLP